MTKKHKYGTISTIADADKMRYLKKEKDLIRKMKTLLGVNKLRISPHCSKRMNERNILYYEILQALSNGRHDPKRDRFNSAFKSWDYSIKGQTIDGRDLRIGITFEYVSYDSEVILVLTVIDPEI